jgi:hypothetical protein
MWKFNFRLLEAFLILPLLSDYATSVTTRTFSKRNINTTTMADTWIPIRKHGKGQNPGNRGGGRRGGRLAPAAACREPPPPGSPIASRISVQHHVPSPTDNLLDKFLQVSPTTHTRRTTVDLAHAKKVKVALKPRVLAPRHLRSQNSTHHNIH